MKKLLFFFLIIIILFSAAGLVLAQSGNEQLPNLHNCPPGTSLKECQELYLNQLGETSGYGRAGSVQSTTLSEKIGLIISYALGFVGIIFFILIIISGIQWMIGGEKGEKEKISKAQARIKNAIIGLIIVLAAYAITWFVVTRIRESASTQVNSTAECTTSIDCEIGSAAADCHANGGSMQCLNGSCQCVI